ncbi:ankyrin repeat-containing domain protein [Biscogniauxia marginata]|nr:ankyrin repeat-containing domain protein [Biscogniauxia marginata]
MASLVALPDELLLPILGYVDHLTDLSALAATCTVIHPCAEEVLYQIGAKRFPYLLCWACELGFCNVVAKLLKAGADPNKEFYTHNFYIRRDKPLCMYRCRETYIKEKTDSLRPNTSIVAGARFDRFLYRNSAFWYPVHCAANKGHNEIINLLVRNHADINKPSRKFCECEHPHWQIGNPLLDPRDHPQWTALHIALCSGHESTANLLLELGASPYDDVNNRASNAIYTAAMQGFLTTVKLLVQGAHPVDINIQGPKRYTPLCYAHFSARNDAMISWMLNNGARIDAEFEEGDTLIHLACIYGWFDEVIKLIEAGGSIYTPLSANTTSRPYTLRPLDICCEIRSPPKLYHHVAKHQRDGSQSEFSRARLVELMITKGASVHRDNFKKSPLVLASSFHLTEVMKVLISNGANVCEQDHLGCFPLLASVRSSTQNTHCGSNMRNAASILLRHGANICQRYGQNHTILHALYANKDNFHGRAGVLMLLLHYGAELEELDPPDGHDMLRRAFQDKAFDECRILLKHGTGVPAYWRQSSERLSILVSDLIQEAKRRSEKLDSDRRGLERSGLDMLNEADVQGMKDAFIYLLQTDERLELLTDNIYLWEFTKYPETGLADILLDTGIRYDPYIRHGQTTCLHNLLQPSTYPLKYPNLVASLAQRLINIGTGVHWGMPILQAIEQMKLSLVIKFIDNGAKVPLPSNHPQNVLFDHLSYMIADSRFPEPILSLVIDNIYPTTIHPDVNSCYLFAACKSFRKPSTIRKLVANLRIDINSRDLNGNTALILVLTQFIHPLYESEYIDWVKVLVNLGSDLNVRNRAGQPAWYFLKHSRSLSDKMRKDIYKWLRDKAIADSNNNL